MNETRHKNSISKEGVSVIAPARLHMGFIDLNGQSGRCFGSFGLGIEDLSVCLSARVADTIEVKGPAAARAAEYAGSLLSHHGLTGGVHLEIHEAIPEHAGLGSGTQMALAVGTAVARLYDLPMTTDAIALALGRGARSGIGIGSFMQGGFIVDAGRGESTGIPPVVSRLHFPDSWRIVLVFDPDLQGVSGPPERTAFEQLEPMAQPIADRISWLLLMQILPAVAESDCDRFGEGISQVQSYIGEYFAPVQGGAYYSPAVAAVVQALQQAGAAGVGQSSWGPTGFAVFPSETQTHKALRQVRALDHLPQSLEIRICRGRNRPAEVIQGSMESVYKRRLQGI